MFNKCLVLTGMLFVVSQAMAGEFTTLHKFDGVNGAVPYGSVILDNGTLYGTTVNTNATQTYGTVFSLKADGSDFTTLKSITASSDGTNVYNGLTLVSGTLYGITRIGGANNLGTLFKLGTDGSNYSLAHSFAGGSDGANPYSAPALYNNKLYGLTYSGGTNSVGTLYEHDLATAQTQIVHSFSSPGVSPFGSLTPVGEWLYGMTSDHVNSTNYGNIFRYKPSDDTYEVVHSFAGTTSGGYPYDSLVWDGGTWAYGTTLGYYGAAGLDDEGVVFRLNIQTNAYEVLHDFSAQTGDGAKPNSSMLLGEDGLLYGIAHGNETWG